MLVEAQNMTERMAHNAYLPGAGEREREREREREIFICLRGKKKIQNFYAAHNISRIR